MEAGRLDDLEHAMEDAAHACLELVGLAEKQAAALELQRRRQRWWNRCLGLALLLVSVRLLTACGGAAFETSSPDASPLAGAQSSAGAQAGGGAAALSGGAGGVAGGNTAGNSSGPAGSGGDLADVLGGAGGAAGEVDSAGAPAIHLPCDTSAWKASAFASQPTFTPELAVDGDLTTRWQSGEARAAGQWFALELGAGVVLERLELSTPDAPGDVPSSLELELDGKRVAAEVTPSGAGLWLTFKPTPARAVRLVLDAPASLGQWWTIDEVGGLCQ